MRKGRKANKIMKGFIEFPRLFDLGPYLLREGGVYIIDVNRRSGARFVPGDSFFCSYPGYMEVGSKCYTNVIADFYLKIRDDVREISSYKTEWNLPVYIVENGRGERMLFVTIAAYIYEALRGRNEWVPRADVLEKITDIMDLGYAKLLLRWDEIKGRIVKLAVRLGDISTILRDFRALRVYRMKSLEM